MKKTTKNTVDDYISGFTGMEKAALLELKSIIRSVVKDAEEKISYGIPTFFKNGNIVHFGASKKHLGFYPGPAGIEAFEKDLRNYVTSRGAIQFSYEKKLPAALIKKIVKYRLAENEAAYKKKKEKTLPSYELPLLSQPATNALLLKGIKTVKKLSNFTRKEILDLHGMGPASMPALEQALKNAGLTFRK